MEIVVRQISGLGNQLFQYAAGLYYAKKYGGILRVATEPAERALSYGHPRPFLLKKLQITAPCSELTSLDRLALTRSKPLIPISFISNKIRSIQVVREPWAERYEFHPDLGIGRGNQTVFLVGYWQVHTIPDAIETDIRQEFSFVDPPAGKNRDAAARIQDAKTAVSLHIRRGDYTHPSEGNIALPISYYFKSVRAVQNSLDAPTFFVFSDDIAYAREHLPKDVDLVFVDHNDAATAQEDLRLMSLCEHHIIANSTLSWWGAWLNPNPEKMVIAPKYWRVGGCTETRDLFPCGWTQIEDE